MKYDIDKLTVNELFCGIGSQRKALERLGISHEVVGIAEIDKYAIQSYESIFGKTYNYGDISKVESLNYADLWTYSFPCIDLSVAGTRKGFIDEDGNQTRSGLLYEVERLLDKAKETNTLPKLLLMENVKNLVGKEFKPNFDKFLCKLTSLGYNNYWQVLNSKDYGIPQNRERVFVVSIRKDIDKYGYVFPKKLKLTKVLKDILENTVDDKYYLSHKIVERFKICENLGRNIIGTTIGEDCTRKGQRDYVYDSNGIIGALCSSDYKQPKQILDLPCIGASRGRNPENPSDRTTGCPTEQRLEINTQGISNTITTVQKDNYVVEAKPKLLGGIGEITFGKQYRQGNRVYDANSIAMCLTAQPVGNAGGNSYLYVVQEAKIQQIQGNLYPNSGNPQAGRVYSAEGLSPTLDNCQGGNHMPKIIEAGYYSYPNSNKKHQTNTVYSDEGISPALNATDYKNPNKIMTSDIKIRKLTPLECWRLMGFDDEDFNKVQSSGVSDTQLYKQAGNSIVVDCLYHIFKSLLVDIPPLKKRGILG